MPARNGGRDTMQTRTMIGAIALTLAVMATGAPAGDAASNGQPSDGEAQPLSAEQLTRCASRVQTLRHQSRQLNQQAAQFDQRRAELRRQFQTLKNKAEPGETAAPEGAEGQWAAYDANASAFNRDIADFRRKVRKLNQIKQAYDRDCAGRAYRQSDLAALPADARKAMKAGTADIRVPTVAEDEQPGAGTPAESN